MPTRRAGMALDMTYLKQLFAQMMLHGQHGITGGCWTQKDPFQAFISMDGDEAKPVDTKLVTKAAQMFLGLHNNSNIRFIGMNP
jgi:hypothetical protein